jgi:hypothetical protein
MIVTCPHLMVRGYENVLRSTNLGCERLRL